MTRRSNRKSNAPSKFKEFELSVPTYNFKKKVKKNNTSEVKKSKHRFFFESIQANYIQLIANLGIDNMVSENYISSTIDKPELVRVNKVNLLSRFGGRGLFATQNIPQGTIIGMYTGEIFSPKEFEEGKKDNSYAMQFNGEIVDAKEKGNFTRYINFSDSQDNVEFVEGVVANKKVVKVVTTKDILAGQQLLVDYNTYDERASSDYFFLNDDDTWLSAAELHQQHASQYQLMHMTENLPQFNLQVNETFYATHIGKIIIENKNLSNLRGKFSIDEVNLPYLKTSPEGSIINFDEADSFTPLMLAGYFGQVNNVAWLINHNANINKQQNHSGNGPLFFALLGYQSAIGLNKSCYMQIINLLIDNNVNLKIHDRSDLSFLHKAVNVLTYNDFNDLISKLSQKDIDVDELFTYVDKNNDDIFLYCLRNKYFDQAKTLLDFYPDYFQNNYLCGDPERREFNRTALQDAIQEYSETEQENLDGMLEGMDLDLVSLLSKQEVSQLI